VGHVPFDLVFCTLSKLLIIVCALHTLNLKSLVLAVPETDVYSLYNRPVSKF